jgi:predicted GNAT family acetyltransferase
VLPLDRAIGGEQYKDAAMTSSDDEHLEVTDNPDAQRYELFVDGKRAGFTDYRLLPGRIVFRHSEVSPEFQGRGLAARLAAGVLDDARARGLMVTPVCPYVARYIEEHPEYADLVAPGSDA